MAQDESSFLDDDDPITEVTTVADDEVVMHRGGQVHRFDGLEPDTDYVFEGVEVRTLLRPPGARLATVATVNDVHFGETECGVIAGLGMGEVFRSADGEAPYPETMNAAAVAEIAAIEPDAVVAKGDLTTTGSPAEYESFLACYGTAFGDRLHHVRGNHDGYAGEDFAAFSTQAVMLPGVVLAILDTTIPTKTTGRVTGEQIEWLDDLAAGADRPVLVFGHHHPWSPDSRRREPTYFGINPDDSDALVALAARRPAVSGYFAGHTHRNRVRRFAPTGPMPWAEVACVKDFPGSWAEYRVFEGGILAVHRRISTPEALAWSERTRAMFGGLYPQYAFGQLADRCFAIEPRR